MVIKMDIRIKEALEKEKIRQQNNIELIASENYASKDVMALQGSIFTNKYAEGYPGKRYYGGCINVDTVEDLAIEYVTKLFDCKYANVQPHSGSSANMAVYKALLNYGDKVMGMNLSHGGHLTHGHPINFSGLEYEIISYDVDPKTEMIDYDKLEQLALETKPKMIIAGGSAYSRIIDFKRFREIADKVGAYLMVDMAHIAGLVATGLHPSPIPYADVVTSTTHKTLRGPRGGIVLTNDEEIAKKINKIVFPGIQGGPLEHVIAGKAVALKEALAPEFKEYAEQVIENAKAMAKVFNQTPAARLVSGSTDNHLLLIDVRGFDMNGKEAEQLLDTVNITVNKNSIPFESLSPFKTSGIRVGTPAITSRGFKEDDAIKVAEFIVQVLSHPKDEAVLAEVKGKIKELTDQHPIYKK